MVVSLGRRGIRAASVGRSPSFALVALALGLFFPDSGLAERCGATERWYVKVGTDPRAGAVDIAHPTLLSVAALNALARLQETVPGNDDRARLDEETKVYTVSAFLAMFKDEDGDDDHLVITDALLK